MYDLAVAPDQVKNTLKKYIQAYGFDFTLDLKKSHGCYLYDATNDREILDFYTYFATSPLGHNHPKLLNDKAFNEHLLLAAQSNPSNSDFYTTQYATFIETFGRVAMPKPFEYAFFIAGGTLAVENALKVAMDWKVQKNFEQGIREEKGHQVIHFREAFHGRSGYTLSLTNTDPAKTKFFAKFDWPRISNPKIIFPRNKRSEQEVIKKEQQAVGEIEAALEKHKHDICAIIIEPIQSEGGDNHFRKDFLQALRRLADEHDVLLVFDEVQNGVGLTGKFWAYEHFGVVPDLLAFGKKMQICGLLATGRVNEVEKNCFYEKSRINSTWGGNLVDMVRATKILQVIEEDKLVENADKQGKYLLKSLHTLGEQFPLTNIRGRGLQCAFDMPDGSSRDALRKHAEQKNLLLLGCGPRAIRFRPPLTVTEKEIDQCMKVIEATLPEVLKGR